MARNSVSDLASSLEMVQTKQKTDSEDLTSQCRACDELQALLTASQADEKLVEHLAGLHSRFDALKSLSGQLAGKLEETTQADVRLKEALSAWQEQTSCLDNESRSLKKTHAVLAEKQSELLSVLEGQEVATWRKSQSTLSAQKDLIAKTVEAVESLSKSRQASSQLGSLETALKLEATTLINTLAAQTKGSATLEKESSLLEIQLTLLKRIEDLEEARTQLQDGEPCPLCGANRFKKLAVR